MLSLGIKGEQLYTVKQKDTSKAMETGELDVFATSSMINLMELTVCKSIEEYLEKGITTVGTSLEVKNLCPMPVGTKVRCESELIKIDGKKLTFKVSVHDNFEVTGTCIHERSVVNSQYFMMKALVKKVGSSNN